MDTLTLLSSDTLGKQIKKASNPRFYVFNPLSWTRNDVADMIFEENYPIKVIDVSTDKEVDNQLITKGNRKYLRIWANNIPSVGYKVFEIQKGTSKSAATNLMASGDQISNPFYKIKLSPSGAITELLDLKTNNRNVVLAGNYLNDLGIKNWQ